ncbi:unnamed protein product, partial [Mycena citricolor]
HVSSHHRAVTIARHPEFSHSRAGVRGRYGVVGAKED